MTALIGARLFDGERFLDDHVVVIEGARIVGVDLMGIGLAAAATSISAAAFSRRGSSTSRSMAAAAR